MPMQDRPTEYRARKTGDILTESEVRALAPDNVSLPAVLDASACNLLGVDAVTATDAPAAEDGQIAVRNGVKIEAGSWVQVWKVRDLTGDELASTRAERMATVKAQVERAVQDRLDKFAAQRGYDNILSACTYAGSSVPQFAADAKTAIDARDAHWAKCYEIMADVLAGKRDAPSVAGALKEMPALTWPA